MIDERHALPENTPPEVGPYRLLRRLGAGGMGEVFEAYDPRLDRRVAIKRIRAANLSPEYLERFRREARIGAGLIHSGIVQVFDVTHLGEHECLVLEFVPGESLRQHLAEGPLPVARGLDIAFEVAGALAYAHQRGVVHRDLKTENILIDEEGRAKIADFGIARQLASPRRQLEDPTLTGSGAAPGTVRAMAPEQALGEGTDHRSDLFSFGVLLYEMLSGVSPFRAANDLATLNRVVSQPHRPIRELVSEVPHRLADLIDQLLEKEPTLRPRDAGELVEQLEVSRAEVAADGEESATRIPGSGIRPAEARGERTYRELTTLARGQESASASGGGSLPGRSLDRRTVAILAAVSAVAGMVALAGWLASRTSTRITYVAVPSPTVRGTLEGDRATLLAHAVRGSLQRTLVSLPGLSPKAFAEIDAIEGTPGEIARAVAADELVLASLDCRAAGCAVELSRIDSASGGVLRTAGFDVLADDLPVAARAAGHQVLAVYPGHGERAGSVRLEVDPRDYETFLRIYDGFYGSGDVARSQQEQLDELAAIHERSPRFLDAWLLAGDIALHRFARLRNGEDLDLARAMADRAIELAPGDPAGLLFDLRVDLDAGDLDGAEATITRLGERSPGDAQLLVRRAQLLEARGEPEAALELLRRAAHLQPSWKNLFTLAPTAQRQGDIPSARTALERLLERAPGHYRALSLMAQIELVNGDPGKAADLYRQLVERSPGVGELSNL
ncbi:MAG: protein kinase, partial [Holophagales bacterium]|nr:protein kinase [Holophagales bacterium]